MYLAVADLVAAVGLWMRVAWGKVMVVAAAMSRIALHTAFIGDLRQQLGDRSGCTSLTLAVYATLRSWRPPPAGGQIRRNTCGNVIDLYYDGKPLLSVSLKPIFSRFA